jgi:hypothetical protein
MRSANSTAQPRPNPWVTVVLAVVVTLLAGCVGDDEEADPPGSTGGDPAETTVSSTTAAATTPEEVVEAAYMAFLAMLERVTTTSNDPSDPEIAELTVEPMRGAVVSNVTTNRTEGRRWVVGDDTSHTVQSVDLTGGGSEARVTDCNPSNDYLVDAASGAALGETPPTSTTLFVFTLVLDQGSWKVASYEQTGKWDGVTSCA